MAILGDTKVVSLSLLDGIIGDLNPKINASYDLGSSSLRWNTIYTEGIIFSAPAATDKGVLTIVNYPNYGIRYQEGNPDTLKISASGNASTSAGADFCINAHGDGTLATRNHRIPHTGNTTGTVGTATRPVYVNAGTITQGSYELKATIDSGVAKSAAYYSTATTIADSSVLAIDTNKIQITANSNTVSIGSQNTSFTHIYNSADIPFIFNKSILTAGGSLGNTSYPWNNIYLGNSAGTANAGIYLHGSKSNNPLIEFLVNTSNGDGQGIKIGSGGVTVIGAGESPRNLSVVADNETMYVLSDGNIYIEGGANTLANRKGIQINTSGHIIPIAAETGTVGTQSIGTYTNYFKEMYSHAFSSVGKTGSLTSYYIISPQGGHYTTSTGTTTGALKITCPVGWTSHMINFKVKIFTYTNGSLCEYHMGGYNYGSSSSWNQCKAYSTGVGPESNLTVRFCTDKTHPCITIGETTTKWSYVQVVISDVLIGYSGADPQNWNNPWTISFVTTLPTAQVTITNVHQ